ncbi:MAG TPA: TIM44-like domain-containing protein [Candidatus Limnocylindrales bacterium]
MFRRSKLLKLATIALLVLLVVALVVPTIALARAGGGHTSNPGRSGGSSSRSSGGSSGGGIPGGLLLIPFVGNGGGGGCCGFLILVVIVVIVLVVINNMRKGGGPGPGSGAGGVPADAGVPTTGPAGFDELRANDPNFSEQAFYGRVNEMFLAIQKAWEARNMEPARRFLAEQQFQVLADGVGEYVRNGQINKLDSIHIDRIAPVSVSREGDSDYVKVMITATVIDYTIDERSGQIVNPGVLGDGKTPKTFDEYWTLVRKVGAQTKSDATIKKCPNCGGPVTDGNYVKCAYCGTMMNDPALDWVLLRIEQP